jgi:hypothetical protein
LTGVYSQIRATTTAEAIKQAIFKEIRIANALLDRKPLPVWKGFPE